jgi:hypothetical protein
MELCCVADGTQARWCTGTRCEISWMSWPTFGTTFSESGSSWRMGTIAMRRFPRMTPEELAARERLTERLNAMRARHEAERQAEAEALAREAERQERRRRLLRRVFPFLRSA